MTEKLERLVKSGVEVAHIGICAKKRDGTICPYMQRTADWLTAHGIEVVWGTH
jgi:predicted metal-binding protein